MKEKQKGKLATGSTFSSSRPLLLDQHGQILASITIFAVLLSLQASARTLFFSVKGIKITWMSKKHQSEEQKKKKKLNRRDVTKRQRRGLLHQ